MADNLKTVADLTSKIHLAGTIRLFLVALLFLLIWIFKGSSWVIIFLTFLSIAIVFTLLMVLHNKLSYKKDFAETLAELCKHELKGIEGDYSSFEGTTNILYKEHPYAEDLDLFGNHSLLQAINRTVTPIGHKTLVNWLLNPLTSKKEILTRQTSIKEISKLPKFRQTFYTLGHMQSKFATLSNFNATINEKTTLSKSSFWKIMLIVVPAIWLMLLIGNTILPSSIAVYYFIICLIISNFKGKLISTLHNIMGKTDQDLNTYAELIKEIEKQQLTSVKLVDLQGKFTANHASKEIKKLSRYIEALNQRYSLMGIILNILLLRDIHIAIEIEKWIETNGGKCNEWLNALGEFDAFVSLGTFAFNHPHYIYPEITEKYFTIEGQAIGHPLMQPDSCVTNDINIKKAPNFMIITGANMAGKSTYLRTIGINHLLSCIGSPVFARKLRVYPAELVTSLRTSDSLNRNESYFFAELKRLKMIIDRLKNGDELFIILDEILKGTNSVDKQKGSIALLKQLVDYKTCGIIATHDLILGDLIKDFPKEVSNFRFEASIKDNELFFTYKMLEGIAQNMNACFLMKKMGITL